MTPKEYLVNDLTRMVEKGVAQNADLAERIVKYGACDTQGWLQDYLRDDAKRLMAQEALRWVEDKGITAAIDEFADRLDKETSYLIPTNSDTQAKVHLLQARRTVLERLRQAYQWAQEKGESFGG